MKAAIEEVRPALHENTFASVVQEAIDTISTSLDSAIDQITPETVSDSNKSLYSESAPQQKFVQLDQDFLDDTEENLTYLPAVGDSIDVYWPLDDTFNTGKVY